MVNGLDQSGHPLSVNRKVVRSPFSVEPREESGNVAGRLSHVTPVASTAMRLDGPITIA